MAASHVCFCRFPAFVRASLTPLSRNASAGCRVRLACWSLRAAADIGFICLRSALARSKVALCSALLGGMVFLGANARSGQGNKKNHAAHPLLHVPAPAVRASRLPVCHPCSTRRRLAQLQARSANRYVRASLHFLQPVPSVTRRWKTAVCKQNQQKEKQRKVPVRQKSKGI